MSFLPDLSSSLVDMGCGRSFLSAPEVLSLNGSSPGENAAGGGQEVPRCGGGLYNFIKVLAKLEDSEDAKRKLCVALDKASVGIDAKNAKGSTALHACGYLKRWDLAKILLDAGASPTLRNVVGHSFFLMAVKDEGSSWESMFASHPDLIEAHLKYVAKAQLVPRKAKRRAEKPRLLPPRMDEGVEKMGGATLDADADADAVAVRVKDEDWLAVSALTEKGCQCLTPELGDYIVRRAPSPISLLLLARGLLLTLSGAQDLLDKMLTEAQWASVGVWGKATLALPQATQAAALSTLLNLKQVDTIDCLVFSGWKFDEDFIEQCEERCLYDLADRLIDAQSERRARGASAPHACEGGKKNAKPKGSARGNGKAKPPWVARQGGMGKRPRLQGGGKQRVAKIANLDGPLREANDFEYQERKPLAKAPVIIVKKARVARESEI